MKGYFYYAAICLTSRSDHTSPSGIKHAHCTYFMGKNNVYVRYVRSQLDQLAFVLISLFSASLSVSTWVSSAPLQSQGCGGRRATPHTPHIDGRQLPSAQPGLLPASSIRHTAASQLRKTLTVTHLDRQECLLWPPYRIGQAIIFLPCGFFFYLSSLFFPRLISTVADWMSTIVSHMAWP